MITQSGCFGQSRTPDPIDDIGEAAEALDDIMGSASQQQQPATDSAGAAMPALAALVGQYARHVRLLTWAVALMAVAIVLKEL